MITKLALGLAFALLAAQTPNLRNESNDARRARLVESCSRDTRWRLTELHDYFVVTDVDDRNVVDELGQRVAAVRASVKALLEPSPAGAFMQCPPAPSMANAADTPTKTVLRLYAKAESYAAAGNPSWTYGYYAPERTEIELFNSSIRKERLAMFQTAQRLVVRETLDTFLARGEHAPWFELGLADYFGDFTLRNGQLEQQPNVDRADELRAASRAGHGVPLSEFVKLRRADYDGLAPKALDPHALRAEGWAFMRFLMQRDGRSVARSESVDRYLAKWREAPDAAAATAFAFDGVDWDALEREWRAFVETIR